MTNKLDRLNVPRQYDRRIKLTDDDIAEARQLRANDPETWSYNKLAQRYGVSKRLMIFRLRPDTLERNVELRQERGGYKTPTARQTEYMQRHRQYKRELIKEGKL